MSRQQFLDLINAQLTELDTYTQYMYQHELKREFDRIYFTIMQLKIDEILLKVSQLEDDEEFVPYGQKFIARKKVFEQD